MGKVSSGVSCTSSRRGAFLAFLIFLAALVAAPTAISAVPSDAFRFLYDADGRLKAAIDPEGDAAVYEWDAGGNLLSIDRNPSSELSVLQLNPARGEAGETIEIEGTGFSSTPASNTVKFNGTVAAVKAATLWSLTVEVPGGATSGPVTVQTPGEGPVASAQNFTVAPSGPSVSAIEPTVAAAGNEVTVSGSGFDPDRSANSLSVNERRQELESASASNLTFKVGSGTMGGPVSVSNPMGYDEGPDLFVVPPPHSASAVGEASRMALEQSTTLALGSEKLGLRLFAGKSGQRVAFKVSEATSSGQISIWGPAGNKLSGSETSFSTSGGGITEPVTLPSTGTYTVFVDPAGAASASLKLSLFTVEDLTGSITPSAEGAKQSVAITKPGQRARYSVTVAAGERVSVGVDSSNFNEWVGLRWLNSAGTQLTGNWWRGWWVNWFWEPYEFTTAGTYTLEVDPEGPSTGSLNLTAWQVKDKTGETLALSGEGSSKTFSVDVPGQKNRITFSGEKDQKVTLVPSSATLSGSFEVLRPNGSFLAESAGGLSSMHGPLTLPETGTYTIVLDGGEASTGSVKLTAELSGGVAYRGFPEPDFQLVRAEIPLTPRGYDDTPAAEPEKPETVAVKDRRSSGGSVGGVTPKMRAFDPAAVKIWHPPRNVPGWEAAEPRTPWAEIADLRAPEGTTALAGQVLERNGLPLSGVEVSVDGTSTTTDEAGRFLLPGLSAGDQILVIDGDSAPGERRYGSYEVNVELANGETTVLDYTVWMTPLDPAGDRRIASPTKQDTSLTTPSIPGLEVRIPEGTVITNNEGKRVRDLNITAIPVNQAPFPLPPFVPIPVYFTAQPGGAYLSKGAQVVYPNWGDLRPGQRAEFWNYDPEDRGWYVYGRGTVTDDGKQVVPDPGVRIWQLTGAMLAASPMPPGTGPNGGASGGDPVDLYSGLFTYNKTDLVLPDTIPIEIRRTYRPNDSNSYSFGIGTTNPYDLRLWSGAGAAEANLIMPDGQRIHFERTTPGSGYSDGVYKSTSTPGPFFASTLKYAPGANGAYWHLELTNGMTYVFGVGRLLEVRDSHGSTLTITRSGEDVTQITSPHGRWVKFSYDGSNRITKIVDNEGREFKYTYTSGRLTKVETPGSRSTEYEYDGSGRMKAIVNPRGNKFLQNEYDANGRVKKQTMGDGGTFEFAYELDEAGKVKATTVTNPVGTQRKIAFNSEGFPTSETEALGTEEAQTTTFERQSGTGLVLSKTDPLGRKTEFEYDSVGNVKEMTRLADTEDAVRAKLEYEPGTTNVTKITDPLGHATEFEYGPYDELVKQIDALENETSFEYDGDGQLRSITNPEGEETTFTYQGGDLVAVTDPLGRTTSQFVDSLGQVRSIVSPGRQRTVANYNEAGEVTAVTSPSGAKTLIGRNADGNVTSLTDPRENETTMTYDAMDRVATETNPLEETSEASYDKAGNLTKVVTGGGDVSVFEYDELGRLEQASFGVEGESAESAVEYEYDDANRLVAVDDSASGEYSLEYDELDRLTEVSGPNGAVGYLYDDAGRRTAMALPGQEPLVYEYDDANRLTELSRGATTVSLARDDAGRVAVLTLPNEIEQLYDYDKAGQATSITYKDGIETLGDLQYAYDANGLTKAVWGSYARLALPNAIGTGAFNAANQLIERGESEFTYDANGNLVDDGANEYDWNARGELTAITGEANASFSYDPFGRRISKTLGEDTTGLLYDGGNVVQEYSGEELTGSVLTGLGLDQLFSRTTGEGGQSYLTDRLGSVIALTDSSGAIDTTYTYEPFGNAVRSGEESDNPFQFTGRENDGTGLQYNRARYYDPAAGRFISQDPAGFAGSGSNLYWYAYGSPLAFTDPTGEIGFPSIPNPIAPVEEKIKEGISAAANNIKESGEFVYDHKGEFASGGALGVCIAATAGWCAVAGAGAYGINTWENIEDEDCDGFWQDQLFLTGSSLVGGAPGYLPRAAQRMNPGGLFPQSIGGRSALMAPPETLGYAGSNITESGLQERYGGGSAATSSC